MYELVFTSLFIVTCVNFKLLMLVSLSTLYFKVKTSENRLKLSILVTASDLKNTCIYKLVIIGLKLFKNISGTEANLLGLNAWLPQYMGQTKLPEK